MKSKIFKFKGKIESVEFQLMTNSIQIIVGIGFTPKYREMIIGLCNFGILITFRK